MAPEEGLFTELSLSPPNWMAFGKAVVSLRMPWQITKGFLQQVSGTQHLIWIISLLLQNGELCAWTQASQFLSLPEFWVPSRGS